MDAKTNGVQNEFSFVEKKLKHANVTFELVVKSRHRICAGQSFRPQYVFELLCDERQQRPLKMHIFCHAFHANVCVNYNAPNDHVQPS